MTAINTRGISVVAYVKNVCNLNEKQFDGLDKLIKEAMRDNFMLERQSSDERLYSKRQNGGRVKKLEVCIWRHESKNGSLHGKCKQPMDKKEHGRMR